MEPLIFSPQNLKIARKEAGYTQLTAAAACGVSIKTIRSYEQGLVDPPLKALREMGRLYGVMFLV